MSSNAAATASHGFAVRRPRPADAVGCALRNAFDRDGALPADLNGLLRALDRAESHN